VLRHLAKHHQVFLATLVDDAADLAHLDELRKLGAVVLHSRIDQPGRRLLSTMALLTGEPITLRYFYRRGLQAELDDLLDRERIDAVFCSSSPMAEYVFRSRHAEAQLRDATRVMDLIDIDSYKWAQYAARSPAWMAWIYRREARVLAGYEQRIAREFNHLYVVSDQEREFFPGGAPANLRAMANGVDLQFFSPAFAPSKPLAAPAVVFTGAMDYWPNVEGIRWFVTQVWPAVRRQLPDSRLYIVGNRPDAEVTRLAGANGVTVTGFVPDTRDYIAGAGVCIAPLRIARGIQNKVLEAMAMGKAVVATPDAFEGVQAVSGRDIVVAGDANAFAGEVLALLRDPSRAQGLGRHARQCVESSYSWERNLARLSEAGL
jgi:sugar transferase (PEP-CTERM/EpsH1 system associated)